MSELFRTSSCVDGVVAMPHRLDAIDVLAREPLLDGGEVHATASVPHRWDGLQPSGPLVEDADFAAADGDTDGRITKEEF